MDNFLYTARDVRGTLKRGRLQALDRIAVLKQLKEMGLTPVSVTENTNEKNNHHVYNLRLIIIGAVSIAVALISIKFLLNVQYLFKTKCQENTDTPIVSVGSKKINTTMPETNIYKQIDPETTHLPLKEVPSGNKTAVSIKESFSSLRPTTNMNELTASQDNLVPVTNSQLRVFSTTTEQVISWIANSRLGDPPPMLLVLPPGEDIQKILNTDIELYDNDNPDIEMIKINVAQAKQMLKDYVAQGGNAQDFLSYYHAELKKGYVKWRDAQTQLMKLIASGDKETAQKYAVEQNRELEKEGIKALNIPFVLRN